MKHTFVSKNLDETLKLGERLATLLHVGDVVLLEGDLGAGKTTLTKGIARGLCINEKVNSPTFNIMKLYLKGAKPLFHIDAYRLEDINSDIGLDEYIGGEGICVIEWPAFISELLPANTLRVMIKHKNIDERIITLSGEDRYATIIKLLSEEFK